MHFGRSYFAHELRVARDTGMFGLIDANKGDYQNGYTDEFPTNIYEVTEAMVEIIGRFHYRWRNFDAKTRRNSTDLEDIFIAHVSGMDVFARSLVIADKLLKDSITWNWKQTVMFYDSGKGKEYEAGRLNLLTLQYCQRSWRTQTDQRQTGNAWTVD